MIPKSLSIRTARQCRAVFAFFLLVSVWPAFGTEAETLSAATQDGLRQALDAYEVLRSELAADRQPTAQNAAELAELLHQVNGTVDGSSEAATALAAAVDAAEAVASATELSAARLQFGELSRALFELGSADSGWAEGWHVFTCPMVSKGYGKWLQPTDQLANPYFGSSMLQCGVASSWPQPAARAATLTKATPAPADQPKFEPGIAGLMMVDVRDHKFLWREIDELQLWEHGNRISVAEFRTKAIEKTAHYLQLEGSAAAEFEATARSAVESVRTAFKERRATPESSGVEGEFSAQLAAAAERLEGVLGEAPRHQLFAPESKKWLLKLAFGPRESKEAAEKNSRR